MQLGAPGSSVVAVRTRLLEGKKEKVVLFFLSYVSRKYGNGFQYRYRIHEHVRSISTKLGGSQWHLWFHRLRWPRLEGGGVTEVFGSLLFFFLSLPKPIPQAHISLDLPKNTCSKKNVCFPMFDSLGSILSHLVGSPGEDGRLHGGLK